MTSPLLQAKLNIPPARSNLVPRPDLIARLNQGLACPLTLLSAPPGFGKTTLLTAWLEQRPEPAAWYSIDERDDDLRRFMTYLVAALQTILPEVGRQALNHLHGKRAASLESVMTMLTNDIAGVFGAAPAGTTPVAGNGFVLVLDDYHLVKAQEIHDAVTMLLEHPPAPMHLVISTRADPPLPLARLRARGQLVELRAADLRFAPNEAAEFFNRRMGLTLTPEQITLLDARSEGWIAGLQLAALALHGRTDVAEFVNTFGGSHHFILDYLTGEVLQRQTPEIQSFMLQTCALDQMNASLADAVTGRQDSAEILTQIERANLFIVPLDEDRHWYRYHHLFADLLKSRLSQSPREQIAELHQKASVWYEQNGFPNEAVEHALDGLDFDRAATLVEQAGLAPLMQSEDTTVLRWISRLPTDLVQTRPFLSLIHAAVLTGMDDFESARARIANVRDAELNPIYRGMAALLRTFFEIYRADLPHAIESLRAARRAADPSMAGLGVNQAELASPVGWFVAAMLAMLQNAAGQLHASAATSRHALESGNALPATSPWTIVLAMIHLGLADVLYEWNDLDSAATHANKCLELCQAWRNEEFESYARALLAQVRQAQGDSGSAFDLVQLAAQIARKRSIASLMKYVTARQVKVLVAQDRIDEAERAVSGLPPESDDLGIQPLAFIARGAALARTRVRIAQGEFGQAAKSLEAMCRETQAAGEIGVLIAARAQLAIAYDAQGDTAQAAAVLASALALAEPEGYVRTFVDLGEKMRSLLAAGRSERSTDRGDARLADYSAALLAEFPGARSQPTPRREREVSRAATSDAPAGLTAPLSDREIEVFKLVADGLANKEIADQLNVTVSTVKTHLYSIFRKLGVTSRTQALAKARALKLL